MKNTCRNLLGELSNLIVSLIALGVLSALEIAWIIYILVFAQELWMIGILSAAIVAVFIAGLSNLAIVEYRLYKTAKKPNLTA